MGTTDNFLSSFGSTHEALDALVERPGTLEAFVNDFGGAYETHWFYDHTEELQFDRKEWVWYKVDPELGNLTQLYGVTNVVKRADNPAALIPWAAKMTVEKLLRIIPIETDDNGAVCIPKMSLELFTNLCMQAKSAHKEVFEEAGDIGKLAHKCIEASIKKALTTSEKKVQELVELPEDQRAVSCATAAKGWMDAHNVRWIETETYVYSRTHGYAGTMDGLCTVNSCSDPACCPVAFKDVLSVADWKSSNRLRTSYVFQVAAYKQAKQEETGGIIPDCWILRLGKEDVEFEPWHLVADDFADDFAGYDACLELLKIVDIVEERISTQKHNVTIIQKEQRAAAKAFAVAAEKLRKATEKAEKKLKQAEEKAKVKAEAKVEREKLKAIKLNPVVKEVGGPNGLLDEDTFTPIKIETEENQ